MLSKSMLPEPFLQLDLLSAVFAVSFIFSLSMRKQVVGRVGDEFTETNDGLGSLTTLTELARNVNVNPVEVSALDILTDL